MPSYNEEFKALAVHLLYKLKKEGTLEVDSDLYVNNVRELVAFLDISSYSLYKWVKEFEYEGNIGEEKIEVFKPKEINSFDDIDISFASEEQNGDNLLTKQMKDIGYWQSLARALGLKNYRQRTNQLKLRIGLEIISSTGLVDANKIKKELKL